MKNKVLVLGIVLLASAAMARDSIQYIEHCIADSGELMEVTGDTVMLRQPVVCTNEDLFSGNEEKCKFSELFLNMGWEVRVLRRHENGMVLVSWTDLSLNQCNVRGWIAPEALKPIDANVR